MTKRRAPLSIDAALARIAGQLPGAYAEMAERCERSESMVRAWGDPDRREKIPMDDAIVLDIAFQAAGGEGAPIFEAYAAKLELAELEQFVDGVELLARVGEAAREWGEANEAIIAAARPGAGPVERSTAFRELAEAFETIKRLLPLLERPPP